MTHDCNFYTGNTKWNARKDRILRKEWGKTPAAALAERFGCRLNTVRDHAMRLGLLRRDEKLAK